MVRSSEGDPEHEILPQAFTWEIVGFNLQREPPDGSEPHLDLTVKRESARRVLRFWSPRDIEIERGGPTMTSGLVIYDVRGRGLDGLGVWVTDFEGSSGAVGFWARRVDEI